MPRVTGIVPNHCHADTVLRAIGSLVINGVDRVVCIDDGSSDGSLQVILSGLTGVRQTIPGRVEGVMSQDNCEVPVWVLGNPSPQGPSCARNKAMREAWDAADFFALLDADDYYVRGAIALLLAELGDDQMKAVAYGDHDTHHIHTGTTVREYREPYCFRGLRVKAQPHSNCLIRKDAIGDVGMFDEALRVSEDWDLWLRLSEKYILCHVPECLTIHMVTGKNSTQAVPSEVWQSCWGRVREKENQRRGL